MTKLIFIGEPFAGREFEFALEKTTVGRGDQNTLTIHEASVSQSHCEILVNGTEVIVRDLGSSNGTLVNGVRLYNQQRPLHDGQIVKFGSVVARLKLQESSPEENDTEMTAIHSHARILRAQREAPKPPPAPLTLESDSPPAPTDQTLILPKRPDAGDNNPGNDRGEAPR